MKKYVLFGILAIAIISISATTYSITGMFSKAFDKTLNPGEYYERNITVRNSYNLTVRFQKETSSSTYLTFDNNETVVELNDGGGNLLIGGNGVSNGKIYFFLNKTTLDSIKTISAYKLGEYLDVVNQSFNITYSGTTAYITVKVRYKPSAILGYIIDELTNQTIEGAEVFAFANSANPQTEEPIAKNVSDNAGKYLLTLQLNDSKSLDIYVKDYDVV